MTASSGVRFLAQDIWDAPEDDKRYEVLDGELVATPSPSWAHQSGLGNLYWSLAAWIHAHGLGKIVPAPLGVVLSPHTGVQPDLVYVSSARLGIITERGIEGALDLVVEVLSPSTEVRDRGIKMRLYAAAGIPSYWLLDPQTGAVEPYRLSAGGYESEGIYRPGSVYRPSLFPGLELPIADLWA